MRQVMTLKVLPGYKWSVESNPGEGIFDYIRTTTKEQPGIYTAVEQNGALTDELIEGDAIVHCAYPVEKSGYLFAALYEDGRLVSVTRTAMSDLSTTFNITSPETSEIKVMYWETTESLLPKTESYAYGVTEQ